MQPLNVRYIGQPTMPSSTFTDATADDDGGIPRSNIVALPPPSYEDVVADLHAAPIRPVCPTAVSPGTQCNWRKHAPVERYNVFELCCVCVCSLVEFVVVNGAPAAIVRCTVRSRQSGAEQDCAAGVRLRADDVFVFSSRHK